MNFFVCFSHGYKEVFSCRGINIVIEWFKQRGHRNIVVFVPLWRQETGKPDSPITDQEILNKLQKEKILVFTPSRRINGRRVVCYDDRYIVQYASDTDSVIVSNDNFRDLYKENPDWKSFIEQRLLMYSFVNDRFMPPDDPLGRCGPTLDEFLKKGLPQNKPCPYKNKCTYGSKCRYYHPEKENVTSNKSQLPNINMTPQRNNVNNSVPAGSIPYKPFRPCSVEQKLYEQQQYDEYSYCEEVRARGSIPPEFADRRHFVAANSHKNGMDRQQQVCKYIFHISFRTLTLFYYSCLFYYYIIFLLFYYFIYLFIYLL